ncbi:hypothetical protein ACJMK2_001489 [Sinanodonta woodiana]|uniref:Uncharacterized protein n=1 Tax=Sinanodonta woodiana TaxID=1069815 RepID=A0ABD3XVS0_SINWO
MFTFLAALRDDTDRYINTDNLTEDRIRHLLSSETDLKVYISDNPPEACIKILLSQASKQNRKESMKIILHCIVQRFTARFSEKQVRIWPGEEVIGSVNVQTVLVCFYSGSVDISFKSFYDLKVIYRDYYTTDKESSLAREHERNINDLTSEHCDLINEAITINGKSLFAKHSNLEAVSSSGILSSKSRGLVQEPCVILYCRVKGIIPFGEMPFPKRLKVNEEATIAVDVREGYFSYYADSRNKDQKNVLHHENMQLMESLKMGLSIGSAGSLQSGTIGPFVQINSDRIGFLTCAHVVYCQSELIYLANIAQTDPIAKEIVQPPDNHYYASHYQSNHRLCGKVLHAMFCGDWSPSSTQAFGIDAAVIEITSRFPNAGAFVPIHQSQLDDAGFSLDQPPKFDTGHMILHPINWRLQRAVIKIGSETGLTRGLLRLTNGMVKYSKLTGTQASIDHDRPEPIEIIMHGLMEISGSCNSNPFCSHGDSGAGVFIVADDDNTNKLICLGLLNGTITDGISTAMPIDMILTALHRGDGLQLKLKDF